MKTKHRLLLTGCMMVLLATYGSCASRVQPRGRIVFLSGLYSPGEGYQRNPLYLFEMDPASRRITRLTTETVHIDYPVWSPDGRQMVLQCQVGEQTQGLCLADARGKIQRELVNGVGDGTGEIVGAAVWTPRGNRVLFRTSSEEDDTLYSLDVRSGATKVLLRLHEMDTRLTHMTSVSISPDGETLLVGVSPVADYADHLLVDVDTSHATPLLLGGTQGAWLSDGRRIAFFRHLDIMLVDPGGDREEPLFQFQSDEGICPVATGGWAWSPDRRYVAFMSACGEGGASVQYMLDTQTRELTPLLAYQHTRLIMHHPSWGKR